MSFNSQLINTVFLKMSQISQDSTDVDAPASSIDSTSVLENELLAKVNEPVAKVNVPPTHFSNRHSHKYYQSILRFQKNCLLKYLKFTILPMEVISFTTFFHGLYHSTYEIPNHDTDTKIFQYIQAVSPTDHSYKELRSTKVSNVTATPKKRRLKAQFIFKRKQGGA